ncbi:hypothetical protein EHP00_822 [Ecytonucleospora hepatopenaei]|uniref:Transmembrane protein n=1 Tax=Ecytonucleospora hepatopenaei TaxID=646526 RepID=A0A1W0E8A9_9MICR|nr:hypothetical protein EHP00_822 [Ecytonucleospora hepatopenaei]
MKILFLTLLFFVYCSKNTEEVKELPYNRFQILYNENDNNLCIRLFKNSFFETIPKLSTIMLCKLNYLDLQTKISSEGIVYGLKYNESDDHDKIKQILKSYVKDLFVLKLDSIKFDESLVKNNINQKTSPGILEISLKMGKGKFEEIFEKKSKKWCYTLYITGKGIECYMQYKIRYKDIIIVNNNKFLNLEKTVFIFLIIYMVLFFSYQIILFLLRKK